MRMDCDDEEIVLEHTDGGAETAEARIKNVNFSDGGSEEDVSDHPKCWSLNQYVIKCKQYKWLTASSGRLGCKVCRDVKNIAEVSEGMYVSVEWANCLISSSGGTREKQQVSLRKKICLHRKSNCHVKAGAILESRNNDSTPQFSVKMQVNSVFRTAYNIAKMGRPFTDLPVDVDLQALNGANLGRLLHSSQSCADIIDHIAMEMRMQLVKHILQNESKICIVIDECNTFAELTLIICIRACFGKQSHPLTFFLDLVELPEKKASVTLGKLLSCLEIYGFTDEYLKMNLIQLVTDGESSIIGRKSGVWTLLKLKCPQLVVWHCASHKLELAVGYISKEVAGVSQLMVFFDKLCAAYHASPKNRRELGECAAHLEERLLKVGKILDLHWVASSKKSVSALFHDYAALSKYFCKSSADHTRTDTERKKYASLHQMLTSVVFVENLGVLYDALTELANLAQKLQHPGKTLYEGGQLLHEQACVFHSMAESPGPFAVETATAVAQMELNGIALQQSKTKGCISIDRWEFFSSLANHVRQRITVAPVSQSTTVSPSTMDSEQLVHAMHVLKADDWLEPVDMLYGETKLQAFCDRFHIVDASEYISAFREYKGNGTCVFSERLRTLTNIIETFSTSTAECERVLGMMNEMLTHFRSRMSASRLSSLLFINIVGPALTEFRPDWYVHQWFKKGRRSADATNCMGRKPTVHDPTSTYKVIWDVL